MYVCAPFSLSRAVSFRNRALAEQQGKGGKDHFSGGVAPLPGDSLNTNFRFSGRVSEGRAEWMGGGREALSS